MAALFRARPGRAWGARGGGGTALSTSAPRGWGGAAAGRSGVPSVLGTRPRPCPPHVVGLGGGRGDGESWSGGIGGKGWWVPARE